MSKTIKKLHNIQNYVDYNRRKLTETCPTCKGEGTVTHDVYRFQFKKNLSDIQPSADILKTQSNVKAGSVVIRICGYCKKDANNTEESLFCESIGKRKEGTTSGCIAYKTTDGIKKCLTCKGTKLVQVKRFNSVIK